MTMKTILVATIGTNPAVLTETVWALAVNGKKCLREAIVPDYVKVFTYAKCVDSIRESILEKGANGFSGWDRLKEHLRGRKIKIDGKLGFGEGNVVPYAKSDGTYIQDAFAPGATEAIPDTFVKELKALRDNSSEPIRIIASISGGRKTDGALLMSCMGLLGQEGDRVVHLIPSMKNGKDFQVLKWTAPQFLFPEHGTTYSYLNPEYNKRHFSNKTFGENDVDLNLFEIPLLMTGKWYKSERTSNQMISYSELLAEQKRRVDSLVDCPRIRFDLDNGQVMVDGELLKKRNTPIRPISFWVLVCDVFLQDADEAFYEQTVKAFSRKAIIGRPRWIEKIAKPKKNAIGPFRGDAVKSQDDLRKIRSEICHLPALPNGLLEKDASGQLHLSSSLIDAADSAKNMLRGILEKLGVSSEMR
jgi:CRISPR-associated protein (TIGR02584 family)